MESVKNREKPEDLMMLEVLNRRMDLCREDQIKLYNLTKGYEGECRFDTMTDKLTCDCLVIKDVRLKENGKYFQIDTMMISPKDLIIHEVKNYEGEFILEEEKFLMYPSKKETNNPFEQLTRCRTSLRQFIASNHIHLPIKSYVTFVNPRFTLYNAQPKPELLLPNKLPLHLEQFDAASGRLTNKHKEIADQFVKAHVDKFPFEDLPEYTFESLRKGMTCVHCGSFMTALSERSCGCKKCGNTELMSSAIVRHAIEFRKLFPNLPIKTSTIREWCGNIPSLKQIQYTLNEFFKAKGANRWVEYF